MIFDWQKNSSSKSASSIDKLLKIMEDYAAPMSASDYDFAVGMVEDAKKKYEDRVIAEVEISSGLKISEEGKYGIRLVVGKFCDAIWKTIGANQLPGDLNSELSTLQQIGEMAFVNAMTSSGLEEKAVEKIVEDIKNEQQAAGMTFMVGGASMVTRTLITAFETFDLLGNVGVDLDKIKEDPMLMAYRAWKDGATFSQLAGCFTGIAETPAKFRAILEDSENVRKEIKKQADEIIASLSNEAAAKGGCPDKRWT